jgi:hypothetical protein
MSHRLGVFHFVLVFCILALLVTGCGENRGLVPVRGRVTFDGGPPPKPGWLNFGPTKPADGFVQRPGQANLVRSHFVPNGRRPHARVVSGQCDLRRARPAASAGRLGNGVVYRTEI